MNTETDEIVRTEEAGGAEVCAKNGACATGAYKFVEWVEGDHITWWPFKIPIK